MAPLGGQSGISASARRSVLRVQLKITPEFQWHDRAHGGSLRWHLWVEDSDSENIYHTEVRLVLRPVTRGTIPTEPGHSLAPHSEPSSTACTHSRCLGWPRCGH